MSDTITAKGSDAKFKPHPNGQFVGQCVDTIDLGDAVEQYQDQPKKLAHKCALVFRTGERNEQTGDFIDIAREFTVSMGEKAALRKFLEQWRGKPYTTEQVEAGVPLHKLTGQHGLLSVAHKVSGKGNLYATIAACVGVPKQMASTVTEYSDYVRADFWEQKKKDYADASRKFRADASPASEDDFPAPLNDDDDDLPF